MRASDREALARRALELSTAPATEVMVVADDSALTRFTHNSIHQNVAAQTASVRIRAIEGSRQGVASTGAVDDASLKRLAQRALEIARLSPEDPELPVLPSAGAFAAPAGAFVQSTAEAGARRRAEVADAIFRQMEHHGQWGAGFVTTSSSGITLANSNGLVASFDSTDAGVNVKANAVDSTGFAEAYARDQRALDGAALGLRAAEKAERSAQPRHVEPGDWTVIIEPPAFGELLHYLAQHFGAQAYVDGSSFASDGLDRPYVGENVTLVDDHAHPLFTGMPFDFEGYPTQRVPLIEGGVVRHVVTDAYYAKRLGTANTGHALPAPNAYGPQARSLVFAPGKATREDLIAGTKRGLLITRFWYIRPVDQRQTIVTGMTRDGTFLIEDGRITGGVRNMRFNQSILDCLRRCEAADDLVRTGGYGYQCVVPTIKVEGFHFSSGTEF
ncbi:MAG TPA: TldD/PmbA family protein [Candidatus Dormibacteraeota bacterium]|nr:TldD/PmbA family protein [Candidatus Dormibacteraeota bacterium]